MSLHNKTAFITGASRGIGKSIALRIAKDGGNVVIAAKSVEENPKLGGTIFSAAKEIEEAGLYKKERIIASPQGAEITVNGKKVLNFCANNYLGLSSHPKVIEAAHRTIDERGYGMSSVRFICGTQDIHKELEEKLSTF